MDQVKSVVARPVTPAAQLPIGPKMVTPPVFTRKAQAGMASTAPAGIAKPVVIPGESEVSKSVAPQEPQAQPQERQCPVYRFAKLYGVAEIIKFEDGTLFTFPLIKRNNMPGYDPTSSVETEDFELANNLRTAAKKNLSIREVK